MGMNKTVQRVRDTEQQQVETFRYWQSRPVGERLAAVWEASAAAYAFADGFKGVKRDVTERSNRTLTRIQRKASE